MTVIKSMSSIGWRAVTHRNSPMSVRACINRKAAIVRRAPFLERATLNRKAPVIREVIDKG